MLGINDALIAAQNVVIAAESLGIGSCYIGDIMENYEIHKKLLNLPDYTFPACMLTLGYYPDNHKRNFRDRFDSDFVVFDEIYADLNTDKLKGQMYSSTFDVFLPSYFEGDLSIGARVEVTLGIFKPCT